MRLFFFSSLVRLVLATLLSGGLAAALGPAELVALHKSLVEIQSTTRTTTDNPATDERRVQAFIETWLKKQATTRGIKLTVERQPVTPGRDNLYVYAGDQRATKVLLTSHVDTVPPHVRYHVEGDKIYGRGANDAKGCVAAMLAAFVELLGDAQIRPAGDLGLLFVVGEEIGGEGMKKVPALKLAWEAVVFGEPTDSKLASGQIGGMVFNVTATGRAAHSGFPERGDNAIDYLRPVMDALHDVVDQHLVPQSDKYGRNSVTIAQMAGGVADNAVPASAWVSGSFRLTCSPDKVVAALWTQIRRRACPGERGVGDGPSDRRPCRFLHVEYPLKEDPLDIDHDVPGFATFGARFGSDISLLPGNHKKYLFGPGSILTAHTPDEFVSREELVASVGGYKKIVLHNLKQATRGPKGGT